MFPERYGNAKKSLTLAPAQSRFASLPRCTSSGSLFLSTSGNYCVIDDF